MRYLERDEWKVYADALQKRLGDQFAVNYVNDQMLLDIPGFMLAFKVAVVGQPKMIYVEVPLALNHMDDKSRGELTKSLGRRIRKSLKTQKDRRPN